MNPMKNNDSNIEEQSFVNMLWSGLKSMFEFDNTILQQSDNSSTIDIDNIAQGIGQMTISGNMESQDPVEQPTQQPISKIHNMPNMYGGGKCEINLMSGIMEAINKSYDNSSKTIFEC